MKEWQKVSVLAGIFLLLYFAPFELPAVADVVVAGLSLLHEYARLHVLTCLVPAFFIAGTIAVYVKKDAILRLLGPDANPMVAYPVASVSGGILAVCSCTILPLFTGIYKRGAGIGPAVAFLFTGPAINITAILLTAGVFGWEMAGARLLAASTIALIAGFIMSYLFREHDVATSRDGFAAGASADLTYSNGIIAAFILLQLAVLVLFSLSLEPPLKYSLLLFSLAGIVFILLKHLRREHTVEWVRETWDLTKKILPYLFVGVFIAGALEVLVPQEVVTRWVGENTIVANIVASTFGALMYFATLTEVPIIQKLIALGMAKGPALTLLLTGNALSLPSMIVLVKVMGKKKAGAYILLIVLLSVIAGRIAGEMLP